MISLLAVMQSGEAIETGIVGADGLVGGDAAINGQCIWTDDSPTGRLCSNDACFSRLTRMMIKNQIFKFRENCPANRKSESVRLCGGQFYMLKRFKYLVCNRYDATLKIIAVAKVKANIVIHICSSIAWQAGARPVEVLVTFLQVVMIDLVLAGDNAIVIGLAAAGLPQQQRTRVILVGILAATALRVLFAGITTQLLQVIGLLLAGGILLLWVCWKMWRELRTSSAEEQDAAEGLMSYDINADGTIAGRVRRKTFGQAALQIIVADVSMSLDNVLAVAGAAREHPIVLVFGLILSIALMGIAANVVARMLQKHRWIAYVGLAIILYVACEMIYRGAYELKPAVRAVVVLL